MPLTPKDVADELQFLSDRLSEQTRTIALSVLALVWLFLAGGDDTPVLPSVPSKGLLLASGAFAFGSLLADYFQYVVAYFDSAAVLERTEKAGKGEYDYSSCRYRLRKLMFWAKQIVVLVAVGFLVWSVSCAL